MYSFFSHFPNHPASRRNLILLPNPSVPSPSNLLADACYLTNPETPPSVFFLNVHPTIRNKLLLHPAHKQIFISYPARRTTSSPQPNWSFESYLIKTCWALLFFLAQSSSPSGQPEKPHPPPSLLSNVHIHPTGIFVLSPNQSPSSSSMRPSTSSPC